MHLRAVVANLQGHDHPRQRLAAINRARVEAASRPTPTMCLMATMAMAIKLQAITMLAITMLAITMLATTMEVLAAVVAATVAVVAATAVEVVVEVVVETDSPILLTAASSIENACR